MEARNGFYHIKMSNGLWYSVGVLALALVCIGAMGPGSWPFNNEAISRIVYDSFSMLCHQLPDRTLTINGNITFVCARCLGFYGGLLISWIISGLVFCKNKDVMDSGDSGIKKSGLLLLVVLVIIMVNIMGQFLGMWNTPVWLRFISGNVLGITLVAFIFPSLMREKYIYNSNLSNYGYDG